jgi:hypothetical protein
MAKFTNDLSMELSMVQHEEILESLTSKYTRQRKEILVKTKETLKYIKSQEYYDTLVGTIGKDDLYKG